MPRGGKRQGKPGVSYPNRSDLNAQPVRTAPAQTYGDATRHREAQQAMPLAGQPAPAASAAPGAPRPVPQLGGLYNESMRSDEPVTAGLDASPGGVTPRDILMAVYRQYPNDDLRTMLERMA